MRTKVSDKLHRSYQPCTTTAGPSAQAEELKCFKVLVEKQDLPIKAMGTFGMSKTGQQSLTTITAFEMGRSNDSTSFHLQVGTGRAERSAHARGTFLLGKAVLPCVAEFMQVRCLSTVYRAFLPNIAHLGRLCRGLTGDVERQDICRPEDSKLSLYERLQKLLYCAYA